MLNFLLESFWFIFPSYIANLAPALVKKVNFLNYPVDFEATLNNKRIFGSHKTYRGLFFGILSASLLSLIQGNGLIVGLILGSGTLFGDLVGSFIKRRINLKPGGKNLLVDELPGSFFALVFAFLFGVLTINLYQCLFLLIIGLPIHILANKTWHKIGLKEVPW